MPAAKKGLAGVALNRTVIAAVVVLIACLVISAIASGRRKSAAAREGFSVKALPANWKGPKTTLLAREGLHYMFSDGSFQASTDVLESRVMVLPSMKDTLCFYTNNAPASMNCRDLSLSTFAESDPNELPSDFECANNTVDAPPLQKDDTHVRILNALYALRKRCIKVCRVSFQARTVSGLPSGTVVMTLPPGLMSTNAFVLSRPNFVRGVNSLLYGVSYNATHYPSNSHNITNYDSSNTANMVQVVMYPVNSTVRNIAYSTSASPRSLLDEAASANAVVAESSGDGISISATQQQSPRVAIMSLNMFYCSPIKSLVNEVPLTEAMTLYFSNPAVNTVLFDKQLTVQCDAVAGNANMKKIGVRRDGRTGELIVPMDAKVVVTYSMNLVTITAMSSGSGGRIQTLRLTGFPLLNVADPKEIVAAIGTSAALPEPFFNLSIPNLLHLAMTLNIPLGSAC